MLLPLGKLCFIEGGVKSLDVGFHVQMDGIDYEDFIVVVKEER